MRTKESQLSKWLEWGSEELAFLGEREARQECERILETLLQASRSELYLDSQAEPLFFPRFSEWIEARKKRIPLAYLLGVTDFWEDGFVVEEGVFIPRPETETLIEAFLEAGGYSKDDSFYFLDLGTGSGNIAVTIAKLFPRSRGVALDLSEKALGVAIRNGERMGIKERLEGVQGDGLLAFGRGAFDVIFSNPPYVTSEDCKTLEPEIQCEPRLALDGGEDGLDFYRRILHELLCLRQGGSLWVEVGWQEALGVGSLFEKERFRQTRVFRDLNQIDRVVAGIGWHG